MKPHYVYPCVLAILISCSSPRFHENTIGTYKIIERTCAGNDDEKEACESITLIEFVQGNFYKIAKNEFAFVVWSGDKDLQYNARQLDKRVTTHSFPIEINISSEPDFVESVRFNDKDKGEYSYGKFDARSILTFTRITQNELGQYIKNYPEEK